MAETDDKFPESGVWESGLFDMGFPAIKGPPHEEVTWITPHAQLCPVCEGFGVFPPRHDKGAECHGCDGKGWVVVR